VDVNAAAVVAAIQAYCKINAQGQWVERSETVSFNELFDRMTREELERYAQDRSLPEWFPVKPQQEVKENACDSEMEELVRRCPIDGKTHTFAELRGQS
jgi:hypothetical protein